MLNLPYEVRRGGKIISRHFDKESAIEQAIDYSKENKDIYFVSIYWDYKHTIEILQIIYGGQIIQITGG